MQSRETQITMVKWTNAGGQTKRANERSFVYRPPAWRRWRNVKTTYRRTKKLSRHAALLVLYGSTGGGANSDFVFIFHFSIHFFHFLIFTLPFSFLVEISVFIFYFSVFVFNVLIFTSEKWKVEKWKIKRNHYLAPLDFRRFWAVLDDDNV